MYIGYLRLRNFYPLSIYSEPSWKLLVIYDLSYLYLVCLSTLVIPSVYSYSVYSNIRLSQMHYLCIYLALPSDDRASVDGAEQLRSKDLMKVPIHVRGKVRANTFIAEESPQVSFS